MTVREHQVGDALGFQSQCCQIVLQRVLNAARIKQNDDVFGLQPRAVAPFGKQALRTRLIFHDDGKLHTTSPRCACCDTAEFRPWTRKKLSKR